MKLAMKRPDYTQLYCQNKKNVDAERAKQLHDYKNDRLHLSCLYFMTSNKLLAAYSFLVVLIGMLCSKI